MWLVLEFTAEYRLQFTVTNLGPNKYITVLLIFTSFF